MKPVSLTSFNGDSKVFTIPMVRDGVAFTPAAGTGALIFTVKRRVKDKDSESVYQKASGAGITSTGSFAYVTQLRGDTLDLFDEADAEGGCKSHNIRDYFVELLWQDTESLQAEPVASGGLRVARRLTQEQTTSVPVITTEKPLPFGSGDIPQWSLTQEGILEVTKEGVTWFTQLTRRTDPDPDPEVPAGYFQILQPDESLILQPDGSPIYAPIATVVVNPPDPEVPAGYFQILQPDGSLILQPDQSPIYAPLS